MSKILNFKGPIKGKDNKNLGIKNISTTEAEIAIYGTIDAYGWYDDSVSSSDVLNALKEMGPLVDTVHVRINSGGGDVFEGIAIHSVLKNSSKKIITYVDGIAASIASIILMAGSERHIADGAMVMIHKPLTGLYGNSTQMMEMIDRLDMVEDQLVSIYKTRVNLDNNQIRNYIAQETYFGADESVEFGFATKKMEEDVYVNIAASLKNVTWMKDKTAICNKYNSHKSKIEDVLKDIEDYL